MADPMTAPALIYLLHGNDPRYRAELTYSILSAWRESAPAAPPEIVLYCDEPNADTNLPVTTRVIGRETLHGWAFGGRYAPAIKLYTLRAALKERAGPVVFVDTDAAFAAPPAELFARLGDDRAVLHGTRGPLSAQPRWNGMLLRARAKGIGTIVRPDAAMCDAGVVGLTPAMRPTLDSAIALARRLAQIEPLPDIVPFALGCALRRRVAIAEAADLVTHYSGWRRSVYDGRIPQALAALDDLSPATARALPTIAEPARPLLARLLAPVVALWHHMTPDQRRVYLAHLCSRLSPTPDDARIWAEVTRAMLAGLKDAELFAYRHLRRT